MGITVTSKSASPTRVSPGNNRPRRLPPAQVWLGPAGVTLLLWLTSPNRISGIQILAAFLLLLFPWWSYHHWRQSGFRGLPLFSAAAALYWLYFTVQLFWGDRHISSWGKSRVVSDAAVTEVMLLVVSGMFFLWLGMRSTAGRLVALKRFPEISMTPWSVLYVQGVAVAGTLMAAYESFVSAGGAGAREIIAILQGTVSLTAVLILLRRVMDGKAGKFEKALLLGIVAIRILLGVSSGWMGAAVGLGFCCAVVYLHKHRRLPIAIMAFMLPYVLFFQAGKQAFRDVFWHGQTQANPIEKVEFWVDASLQSWEEALRQPTGAGTAYLLSYSLSRTSLLTQAANVFDLTPNIVPYQNWHLYSYMAVALIPRLFWPDKPSMNEANQFYQVAYGITRERDLGNVSIAVGTLVEGYISFGWLGAAMVMFLVGVLLDFWNETFLAGSGTFLAAGIGIAMMPQLLGAESQMAQYASGIVQHVFLTLVVFFPVTRWRLSQRARAGVSTPALAPSGFRGQAVSPNRATTLGHVSHVREPGA